MLQQKDGEMFNSVMSIENTAYSANTRQLVPDCCHP